MGGSANFPLCEDGSSTTGTVVELIAGLVLPSIGSLATDILGFASLPPLPYPPKYGPGPVVDAADPVAVFPVAADRGGVGSQLEAVQLLLDGCTDAVAALRVHQNRCAALVVVLLERCESIAALEGGLLCFDVWQRQRSLEGLRAELASILRLSVGAADRLMVHAGAIVRTLPATLAAMSAGVLGWDFAVIIAEETALLRQAGVGQDLIDSYENALLGKASQGTVTSFREKARRLRERSYPETLTARTRQAYTQRQLRISRAKDGMSWLSLYAPAPTIEGIWDQCTLTAQAAQGPHEQRTLTQLRADIAAALLLNQSMTHNNIHTPPTPTTNNDTNNNVGVGCRDTGSRQGDAAGRWFTPIDAQPWDTAPDSDPGPDPGGCGLAQGMIPVFEDPDYEDPFFKDPDHRHEPDWLPTAKPPLLTPPPTNTSSAGTDGATPSGTSADGVVWPPLPKVLPVLLIPALSLLGATNEPAWMEGAGPISIEVARHLMGEASCFYRVLTDPVTNEPLDHAPQQYRLNQAMRLRLRIRDEYCQFPGCLRKASTCQADHITAFEHGGPTILNNLQSLCPAHHRLKHFTDDRTRTGGCRQDQNPERAAVRLRGWKPTMTENNHLAWTSPRGHYYPPETIEPHPPAYPKWLKKLFPHHNTPTTHNTPEAPYDYEENYTNQTLPEPPPGTFPEDPETLTTLWEHAIQRAHEQPNLGNPDAD